MQFIKKIFAQLWDDIVSNKKLYAAGSVALILGLISDISCAIYCLPYTLFCTFGGGAAGWCLGWGICVLYLYCTTKQIREDVPLHHIISRELDRQSPPAIAGAVADMPVPTEYRKPEHNEETTSERLLNKTSIV